MEASTSQIQIRMDPGRPFCSAATSSHLIITLTLVGVTFFTYGYVWEHLTPP